MNLNEPIELSDYNEDNVHDEHEYRLADSKRKLWKTDNWNIRETTYNKKWHDFNNNDLYSSQLKKVDVIKIHTNIGNLYEYKRAPCKNCRRGEHDDQSIYQFNSYINGKIKTDNTGKPEQQEIREIKTIISEIYENKDTETGKITEMPIKIFLF